MANFRSGPGKLEWASYLFLGRAVRFGNLNYHIPGLGIRMFDHFLGAEDRLNTGVNLLEYLSPFITGFLAYHQWFGYQFFATLHMLAGEIMLVAIPFTRLSHMIFAPFTRAYMGSEFGGVRHARDW